MLQQMVLLLQDGLFVEFVKKCPFHTWLAYCAASAASLVDTGKDRRENELQLFSTKHAKD